jgi:biotin operon repressor
MKKSIVQLTLSKKDFWRKYLEVMNPVLNLQNKERDVLACIVLLATSNKDNPKIEEKLLDYDSRVKIRSFLKMSEASLNNNISALRKKKLIIRTDTGFKVHTNFLNLDFLEGHTVEFKIKIS